MSQPFRVGVTRDFLKPDGSFGFGDVGLGILDQAPNIEWEFLPENVRELSSALVSGYDALVVLAPRVAAATLEGNDRLAVVARFGVGYDSVDVDACTRNGTLITITPDGVRRPVAAATITLLLALTHKLFQKDRLAREGRWGDRPDYMGTGLVGRTFGLIGLGNIGREVFTLAKPFGMRHIAYDPYTDPARAAELGVELVDLETLLRTSDFVSICSALTPETYRLINAERLALMKPSAYLINVARGPIVDQNALADSLRANRLQGAAIDVFDEEPTGADHPLFALDNVIVTPHSVCWTDECFLWNGQSACQSIIDVANGKAPKNIVNRAALDHPRWKGTLTR